MLLEITSGKKENILVGIEVGRFFMRFKRISLLDRMFFARNIMVMVSAGLSLTKSLSALEAEAEQPKLKKIIRDINERIIKGETFADALRAHEEIFGDLFINMVEVGETTGKLVLVLKLTSNQMKKDFDLRRKVRGAMMYPGIIVTALFLIGSLMLIYVVPSLAQNLLALGANLPPSTKFIVWLSDMMVHYTIFVFLGAAAIVFGVWRALKIPRVKAKCDRIVLKLPIFGQLSRKFNVARFCRTLAYLITSGVPISRSLDVASKVLGNTLYREAIAKASVDVQKGDQLNKIFKNYPEIFPQVVTQMIQVGEETGKLSSMLLRLAMFFEEDVNETTKNLSTVIEPVLMIFIGAAVAFFAISMLQPIYTSMGNI